MGKSNKKKDKKKLKSLHSALKSLLKEEKSKSKVQLQDKALRSRSRKDKRAQSEDDPVEYKNGRAYIHSKENQLIPRLTDDEVMERHKLADQKMKQVWSSIIDKYANVEDQGDIVDLHTGEIVTDNGHVRNLNVKETESKTRYDSVVMDILYDNNKAEVEQDVEHYNQYSIWDDDDDDDGNDNDIEKDAEEEEAAFTDNESLSD